MLLPPRQPKRSCQKEPSYSNHARPAGAGQKNTAPRTYHAGASIVKEQVQRGRLRLIAAAQPPYPAAGRRMGGKKAARKQAQPAEFK